MQFSSHNYSYLVTLDLILLPTSLAFWTSSSLCMTFKTALPIELCIGVGTY